MYTFDNCEESTGDGNCNFVEAPVDNLDWVIATGQLMCDVSVCVRECVWVCESECVYDWNCNFVEAPVDNLDWVIATG